MTAAPSPGRGGPGGKPPDPPDGIGGRAARDDAVPAAKAKGPIAQTENLGGPQQDTGALHLRDSDQQREATLSSTSETTPSDAQGESGACHAERQDVQRIVDGQRMHTHPPPATPTVSYAAAVRNGGTILPIDATPAPRAITGQWKPRERHLLLSTLAKDWQVTNVPEDSAHHATLRQVAIAPSEVRDDTSLRLLTATQMETLLAYLNGELELQYAPTFLKATLPLLQRAMLEQFHESHVEVLLTTDVPPTARLRRNMNHQSLMAQLYAANADSARGRQMLNRIMDDVKRVSFDGVHTLRFVFNSRRVADQYAGLAFRLNGTCIMLEDTEYGGSTGRYTPARLRRQYALRAYGAEEMGLVVLLAALGQLPGVTVVDAERPRLDSTDIVDNR
ncbi:hypothetical protein PRIC1_004651 [Phytophthora ramorum]